MYIRRVSNESKMGNFFYQMIFEETTPSLSNTQIAYNSAVSTWSVNNALEVCDKAIADHIAANGQITETAQIVISICFGKTGYTAADNYMSNLRSELEEALSRKYGWKCQISTSAMLPESILEISIV